MNRMLTLWTIAAAITFAGLLTTQAQSDEPDAKPFASPGKQVAASAELKVGQGDDARSVTMRYLIFLPDAYGKDNKGEQARWPLLLFLHGSGERGDDLEVVKKHGPPKLVEQRPDFPFVTVSPQCPSEQRWDAAELAALVDHLEQRYQLDQNRLYVTGLSMGGAGTWSLIAHQPERFAAAVPICGGGGGDDLNRAKLFAHLPLWAFYGDQDRPAGIKQCEAIIAATVAAGNKNAQMTIYPNVGHDSWTKTYANEEVYKWLLAHPKPDSQPVPTP